MLSEAKSNTYEYHKECVIYSPSCGRCNNSYKSHRTYLSLWRVTKWHLVF